MIRQMLFVIIIATLITSCENKTSNSNITSPPAFTYRNGIKPDSSDLYSIINFEPKQMSFFSSKYKAASLTKVELRLVDSILNVAVREYNDSVKDGNSCLYPLKNYRKQIIAASSLDGDKRVYVNCFTSWAHDEKIWKKKLVTVEDGGRAYFQLVISLTKKRYYKIFLNGLA